MTRLTYVFILGLACTLAHCSRSDNKTSDNMYLFEKTNGESVLVITRLESVHMINGGCETISDEDVINDMLRPSENKDIRKLSQSEMVDLLRDCSLYSSPHSDVVGRSEEIRRIPFLFRGTKWCGDGKTPENYDKLGYYVETDKCCRAHKTCDGVMLPGETKFNLTNNADRTRYSCECDEKFFECISHVNTFAANYMASIYFNSPTRKCYQEDYPTICKKRREFFFTSLCEEYGKDTSVPKSYMWVPVKKYKIFSIRW